MMRLQEHSLYPVSVYKEVTGKASSCSFIYTRLMSMPDGVFKIKLQGVYPSITDPDALCMIVCDYVSEGTKLYETEAIEEEEEGETDQHQNDLELAVASLNHMAQYKQQNEMPLDDGVFEESSGGRVSAFGELMDDEDVEGETRYTSCDSSEEEDDEEMAAHHSTAVAAATEETPDAEEESDTVPSSNSSLSSASFLPAQRLRGVPSTNLSANSTVVSVTTSDSSMYSSAPRSSSMPPLPPTADISSPSGSDSPATSHASSATNASVASNTNGTSSPSYYHALASTSTSVTATVPGLLPQQTITKTVFKQKKVRLVDRIPIFVAKPGASFRLGERLPQSGVPFKLSARVEFYINKDEKVYKLRNLMN
eukprot:gene8819-6350_t